MFAWIASLLLLATPAPAVQPVQPAPAAQQDWTKVVVRVPGGGFRQGNPDAVYKLVEYGSRSCPICGRFAREGMAELRSEFIARGRVSYEFRDFPVHPQDAAISVLGRCTTPAAFFPVLDAMYEQQDRFNAIEEAMPEAEFKRINALPLPQRNLAWVQALGYDKFMLAKGMSAARIKSCLSDPAELKSYADLIEDASRNQGVNATPTFFLTGRRLDRVITWSQLRYELLMSGA